MDVAVGPVTVRVEGDLRSEEKEEKRNRDDQDQLVFFKAPCG